VICFRGFPLAVRASQAASLWPLVISGGQSDATIFFLDILSDKAINFIKAFRFEAMNRHFGFKSSKR
jgi:hypothetical protein